MRCSTDNRRAASRCESPAAPRAGTVAVRRTAGWAVFTEYRHLVLLLGGGVCALRGAGGDFDRIGGTMAWAAAARSARPDVRLCESARDTGASGHRVFHAVTRRRRCAASRPDRAGRRDRPHGSFVAWAATCCARFPSSDPTAPDRTLGSGGRDAGAPGESFRPGSAGLGGSAPGHPRAAEHLSSLKRPHLRRARRAHRSCYVRLQADDRRADLAAGPTMHAKPSRCGSMRAHQLAAIGARASRFAIGPIRRLPTRDRAPAAGWYLDVAEALIVARRLPPAARPPARLHWITSSIFFARAKSLSVTPWPYACTTITITNASTPPGRMVPGRLASMRRIDDHSAVPFQPRCGTCARIQPFSVGPVR